MMEPLFEATISYEGKPVAYAVHFEAETYIFEPRQPGAPVVKLKRENDEWHEITAANDSLKTTAITELERYLLAQH